MADSLSAFIWYHADAAKQPQLLAWLERVRQQTGISGRLLVRHVDGKTTFMELYDNVDSSNIDRIEDMACESGEFKSIERRCEAFQPISSV